VNGDLKISHGATIGFALGIICTLISILFSNLNFSEVMFRGGVMVIGGVWSGMMIFWLHNLLPKKPKKIDNPEEDNPNGDGNV